MIRKSSFWLVFLATAIVLFFLMFLHASSAEKAAIRVMQKKAAMVRTLALTDLCLFTEANYTRHLSQADIHAPFQDSPLSLEHFPSGSLAMPPPTIRRGHENLD